MKALIVEDEQLAGERLKKMLIETTEDIEVADILPSVEASVDWLKKNEKPDLIFLDIRLADGLSFEIFDRVEVDSPVIFTTAYDEYAVKAFELNSVDYLLKPINKDKLRHSVDKLKRIEDVFRGRQQQNIMKMLSDMNNNTRKYKKRFLIQKADRLVPVDVNNAAYFFAEDKVVILVTKSGERHFINYTLDSLEKELDPEMFFRVNRQYLVSASSIKTISNYFNYKLKLELEPQAENEVIVSRQRVRVFRDWLGQ
jgi:two-component system LytT family response regulator